MATVKKQTANKKQTSGVKTGLLALGIVLIIGAFIFISVLFFKKNEKKPEDKEPTIVEKGPVGDFEFTHEVEKIEVKSQSSEYNTNIVDVNVNLSEDEQKEISTYLDKKINTINELITLKKKLIEYLSNYKTGVGNGWY